MIEEYSMRLGFFFAKKKTLTQNTHSEEFKQLISNQVLLQMLRDHRDDSRKESHRTTDFDRRCRAALSKEKRDRSHWSRCEHILRTSRF